MSIPGGEAEDWRPPASNLERPRQENKSELHHDNDASTRRYQQRHTQGHPQDYADMPLEHLHVSHSGAVAYTNGIDADSVARLMDTSAEDCMQRQSEPTSLDEDHLLSSDSIQPQKAAEKEVTKRTKHNVNYRHRTISRVISKPVCEKNWLGEHPSYHQKITGDEAERRLRKNGGHCYLTRFSKSHDCYILSVYKKQHPDDVFEHFKIFVENGKKWIDGLNNKFDDIDSLLEYYEVKRIDAGLRSIGKPYTEDAYKGAVEQERQREQERQEAEEERQREQDKKCTIL